jgi:hypothetical protein
VRPANVSRMTARRSSVIGLLLVLGLGATGCGRSEDREQATAVAERFFTAVESGDGDGACEQLSVDTREKLEQDEQKPCREAIGEQDIRPGAPARVDVFLTNAEAELDNGDSAFLSQTQEGWRLSAVGCKPGAGPPSEEPMDCELEA